MFTRPIYRIEGVHITNHFVIRRTLQFLTQTWPRVFWYSINQIVLIGLGLVDSRNVCVTADVLLFTVAAGTARNTCITAGVCRFILPGGLIGP